MKSGTFALLVIHKLDLQIQDFVLKSKLPSLPLLTP
jgi:hypothetical protein